MEEGQLCTSSLLKTQKTLLRETDETRKVDSSSRRGKPWYRGLCLLKMTKWATHAPMRGQQRLLSSQSVYQRGHGGQQDVQEDPEERALKGREKYQEPMKLKNRAKGLERDL